MPVVSLVQPVALECKHVTYAPHCQGDGDIHVVKEIQHFADGSTKPHVRFIKNYKRKFGVTKKGHQNHQSKKEAEKLEKLDIFESTQSDLLYSVKKAMGVPWNRAMMRDLENHQYLYGVDILSEALIKKGYQTKWPINPTRSTVAAIDTETDVVNGHERVIICGLSFKDKLVIAVTEEFIGHVPNAVERIHACLQQHLGDDSNPKFGNLLKKRKITNPEVVIVKDDMEAIKLCIDRAHEYKPDFLTAWNALFDWEKILDTCKRHNVNPADLFSDPGLPKQYRYCKLKVGPAQKTTASGVVHNFKPAQRWHTLFVPASFYPVDSMCAYRYVRVGGKDLPEYNLDYVANLVLGYGKLIIPGLGEEHNLQWHRDMQMNHPIEYCVYNAFDNIILELLDEKTNDLSISLPMLAGCSHYSNFNSQPRMKVDDLHFVYEKAGQMIATTGGDMREDADSETASLSDWITMLQAERNFNNGLRCILEDPNWHTNIRVSNADLDVTAAYPTEGIVLNLSKATTSKEVIEFHGIPEALKRRNMINFTGGHVNASEFCQDILGVPTFDHMLEEYKRDRITYLQAA
jgi:hypothetical protein